VPLEVSGASPYPGTACRSQTRALLWRTGTAQPLEVASSGPKSNLGMSCEVAEVPKCPLPAGNCTDIRPPLAPNGPSYPCAQQKASMHDLVSACPAAWLSFTTQTPHPACLLCHELRRAAADEMFEASGRLRGFAS